MFLPTVTVVIVAIVFQKIKLFEKIYLYIQKVLRKLSQLSYYRTYSISSVDSSSNPVA